MWLKMKRKITRVAAAALSRPWLLAFVALAAAAAAVIAGWLARLSGVSWWFTVAYGGIVALGVIFASVVLFASPRPSLDKLADVGRGLIVAVMLALVASSISHRNDVRNAKDSLRLTLSSGKSFNGIDLRGRDLEEAYIGGGKHLSQADLRGAHLQRAVLSHSTLRETDFHGSKTDLSDADLSYSDLSKSDLRSVNLNGADLTQTNLSGARLAGADLRGAMLEGAKLIGADLRGVDLRSAQLMGARLQRALLVDADLRGAKLRGDFRPAVLDDAALSGVRTNEHTLWPKGFDLANAVAELSTPPPKVGIPLHAKHDTVKWIADGDTIALEHRGAVRLSGIDAPSEESPAACYGHRATKALRRLLPLETRVLYIRGSKPQDAYHRNLAFLWLPSGAFINERLVAAGDATFLRLERPKKKKPTKKKPKGEPIREKPKGEPTKEKPKKGGPTNRERKYLKRMEGKYAYRMKRDVIRAAMAKRGLWGACSPTDEPAPPLAFGP